MRNTICASILLIAIAFSVPATAADSTLSVARDLYVSASYDEALTMLGGLSGGARTPDEQQAIDLYRTLCLVALGRTADADRLIEAMLMRDPLYRASTDDLSPRVQTAFQTARKRILPAVIQKQYADAKSAFDNKDWPVAAKGFEQVLKSLADPDITSAASVPPLSDLRTLVVGFHDLSVKMIPPPALPPAPKPVRVVKPVYSADDRDVVAPVAIQQRMPRYPANVTRSASGVLEFVIDENGAVQAPQMEIGIDSSYDATVVAAAKKWMYQPATLDGTPVKYIKRLTISLAVAPHQ
jgi:hypothetical protein